MTSNKDRFLEDHPFYVCTLRDGGRVLLFTWKVAAEATDDDYIVAITKIASYCREYRPSLVVVDKTQRNVDLKFDHVWWRNEILPVYHEAGIAGFAHVTGNSDATGAYSNAPEGLSFKMGEFEHLASALCWSPEPQRQ